MAEVGIRELRDHLSKYLDEVQQGHDVVVTDRGRAIARILPMSGETTLDRLIREGKVTPAKSRSRRRPAPLKTKGMVSDLVADQRR
jgi:prevent-host-death family protein